MINNSLYPNQNQYFGQYKLPREGELKFIQYKGKNGELVKQEPEKSPQSVINNIQKIAIQTNHQIPKIEDRNEHIEIIKAVHVKVHYPNGDIYEGDFMNELPHGKGTTIYSNGSVYEGTWWNGVPEGMGMFIYQDGTVMHVKHVKGLVHGVAIVSYQNENVEYLNFHHGCLHGIKRICFKNGTVYEEMWEYGKRNSQVEIFYKNCLELFYWGESQDLQPHGYGKMFYTNGTILEGSWYKGVFVQKPVPTFNQAPLYDFQVKTSVDSFEESFKNAFGDEKAYNEFYDSLK